MNLLNDFKVLFFTIVSTIGLSFIFYMINLPLEYSIIILVISILPAICLHINYTLLDEKKKIILNTDSLILYISEKKYNLDLSEKIVINGSVGLTRNTIPLVIPVSYYNITFFSSEFGEVSVSSITDINLRDLILKRFDKDIIEYKYFVLY